LARPTHPVFGAVRAARAQAAASPLARKVAMLSSIASHHGV
jgi:hypothetical protein